MFGENLDQFCRRRICPAEQHCSAEGIELTRPWPVLCSLGVLPILLLVACAAEPGQPSDAVTGSSGVNGVGQSGDGNSGSSGVGQSGGSGGEGSVPGENPTPPEARTYAAGPTGLRRLRKIEVQHSVRALLPELPDSFDPAADLPKDNHVELAFAVPGTISELEVNRFRDMAEEAVALLGASPGSTQACAGDEATCVRAFIVDFAGRAFRRTATAGEVDDLMALYEQLRNHPDATFSFTESLDVIVEALLQSPGFLYRWELGPEAPQMDGEFVLFGPFELASRLSYFLWNAPPDAELISSAAQGQLSTPAQIASAASRMMADSKFDNALGDFITQWLEVSELATIVKDSGVYPRFSGQIAEGMLEEAQAFTVATFRGPEPTLPALLTGTTTHVNAALADYYGVALALDGSADLSGTARRGILMQGAVLAAKGNSYRTSPVRRGKFILNRLLCSNVPPPPPDAVVDLPPADPNLTLREQLAQHAASPSCNNCHAVMDPLGLAFENFDGAGAYRDMEGNFPVDASGALTMGGEQWTFSNAGELVELLVQSDDVKDCFVRQWVRYALGRFEQRVEEGAVLEIIDAHAAGGGTLQNLVLAIVQSKPFTHRALGEGELPLP